MWNQSYQTEKKRKEREVFGFDLRGGGTFNKLGAGSSSSPSRALFQKMREDK